MQTHRPCQLLHRCMKALQPSPCGEPCGRPCQSDADAGGCPGCVDAAFESRRHRARPKQPACCERPHGVNEVSLSLRRPHTARRSVAVSIPRTVERRRGSESPPWAEIELINDRAIAVDPNQRRRIGGAMLNTVQGHAVHMHEAAARRVAGQRATRLCANNERASSQRCGYGKDGRNGVAAAE